MFPTLPEILAHVARLFETKFATNLPYHSLQHTLQVTQVLRQLCELEQVNTHDTHLAGIASLFHDTGYYLDRIAHEAAGARLAAEYMELHAYKPNDIATVARLIQTTARDEAPADHLEQIVHDADLHYLGTPDYERQANLLRKEWEQEDDRYLSEKEWLELNLAFMEHHRFYTTSAIQLFHEMKTKNIQQVRQQLNKL